MSQLNKEKIAAEMNALQNYICQELEKIDGISLFNNDEWIREQGGGGVTKIIQKGGVIEKGGVAYSAVHGPVTELMQKQMNIGGTEFFATGVSIVLHPHNPHVPIIHMNVRYFELNDGTFWFGGGIDLTPHYIIESQAQLFHQGLKNICDKYNADFYTKFKNWADEYFFIPHRNETRGIGGIFYDHLKPNDCNLTKVELLSFALDLGRNFPVLYQQQVELGKDKTYTENEIQWRNLRRGRYVEFNLVNDRGTKFGLVSNGRTESILMSLPANASWEYNYQTEEHSKEKQTLNLLKKGYSWIGN